MKPAITISLVFLFQFFGLSQQQVTGVFHPVNTVKYDRAGFTNIDDQELLIEVNESSIRTSWISDEGLELNYEMSDFPSGSRLTNSYGNANTRSKYIINEGLLYEFFDNMIRTRDLLSGEILDSFDFDISAIGSIHKLDFEGQYIHINSRPAFVYDLLQEELHTIERSHYRLYFRNGNTYYDVSEDQLISYDFLSGNVDTILTMDYAYEAHTHMTDQGNIGIYYRENDIWYYFDGEQRIALPCQEAYNQLVGVYDAGSLDLVLTEQGIKVQFIDPTNCNIVKELMATTAALSPVENTTITNTNDSLFIFHGLNAITLMEMVVDLRPLNNYDVYGYAYNPIYPEFILIPSTVTKIKEEVYAVARPFNDHYNERTIVKLNRQTTKWQQVYSWTEDDIAFGTLTNEGVWITTIEDDTRIFSILTEDGLSDPLFHTEDIANGGFQSVQHRATDDGVLISQTDQGLLIIKDTIELNIECSQSSMFYIEDELATGLILRNGQTYGVTINLTTMNETIIPLGDDLPLNSRSFATRQGFWGTFSTVRGIYIDRLTFERKEIAYTLPLDKIYGSGDNILIKTADDTTSEFIYFKDGEFISVDFQTALDIEVESKGDGRFFLLEKEGVEYSSISIINHDGEVANTLEVSGGKALYDGKPTSVRGPLSYWIFHTSNQFQLVMSKFDGLQSKSFEVREDIYYPLRIYKSTESVIFKFITTGETYFSSYLDDIAPVEMDLSGVFLTAVWNEGQPYILSGFQGDLALSSYDENSNTLNLLRRSEANTFINASTNLAYTNRISSDDYIINIPVLIDNPIPYYSEPIFINTTNGTLSQLTDINSRPSLSDSRNYVYAGTDLFFTALSPDDNSRQFFKYQTDGITSIPEITHSSRIQITPTLTNQYISIDQDIQYLQIIDLSGQPVVLWQGSYQMLDQISVEHLPTGIYFVTGTTGQGTPVSGRFIRQ